MHLKYLTHSLTWIWNVYKRNSIINTQKEICCIYIICTHRTKSANYNLLICKKNCDHKILSDDKSYHSWTFRSPLTNLTALEDLQQLFTTKLWNLTKLDFCLTVHHQFGKVTQMNQLDATMIYWSIRSAQHVSGNILPIIRSARLRYLQHMVSCKDGFNHIHLAYKHQYLNTTLHIHQPL